MLLSAGAGRAAITAMKRLRFIQTMKRKKGNKMAIDQNEPINQPHPNDERNQKVCGENKISSFRQQKRLQRHGGTTTTISDLLLEKCVLFFLMFPFAFRSSF